MRPSAAEEEPEDGETSTGPVRSVAAATAQQYKTRRRRGSLRKVALLGRRAQSDRRDGRPLTVDTGRLVGELVQKLTPKAEAPKTENPPKPSAAANATSTATATATTTSTSITATAAATPASDLGTGALGVGISGLGSRGRPEEMMEQSHAYNSTTDEEDLVQIASHPATPSRSGGLPLSLSPDSFYGGHTSQRRRAFQRAKSPLSFSGITTAALPPTDPDWDYSETEWWGWVVLTVTWFVFVVGMGSCLDVWSWAWDVGTTPYAPPELEDDPTLPIVGYYPALIILTCVMAWVWVVVAWVGMKYFRHAKISGD
ncbi:Uncharacterized protein ESCO_002557 [Escovopsis weberi]|uniref:Uncharacterized protein n=1 Tax=Escovopsis weberi TaxID=150374 RepID=A0A0M8MW82_ESCWE|nr:Uncharacterized protein ESCO_002557 [Escovopsis weberi]